jgi:tetratricopeptide (TPR) repeat protein
VLQKILNNLTIDRLRANIILVLSCIVCYAYVAKNSYAIDDDFAFYENAYVQKGIKGIPDILTHPYFNNGNLSFDYRPVASITFAIEKELFGNNPQEAHIVNLLFYVLCVLLAFAFLLELFALDVGLAFVITLLFAIHPVHTEVVASIKNREELLSFIFSFSSFIAFKRYFEQRDLKGQVLYGMAVLVLLLLGFTSKLTAISVAGVMIGMIYFKHWYKQRNAAYTIAGLIMLLSIIYLYVIFSMANRPIYDLENPLVAFKGFSYKIGTTASCFLFYFRFMWWPYPFSFFYGYNTIPVAHIDDPLPILSVFLHLSIFSYGLYRFFKRDVVGLFIMAYFVCMVLYSNLLMLYTGIVSERALFFPSLWFIAAVCTWSYRYFDLGNVKKALTFSQTTLLLILVASISIYAKLDITRVQQWKDTITLMGNDVKHLENSTLANYFYASNLKLKAEMQKDSATRARYMAEAKKYYYITNTISPGYPYGFFRLGLIYRYEEGNMDSSYYYFTTAYRNNNTLGDVAYQYGRAEYEHGNIDLADKVFTALYQQMPYDTFTLYYHAQLQMKTGHLTEGMQVNEQFMKMAPSYYQPYYNAGLYYQLSGQAGQAAAQYEEAIKRGLRDRPTYAFLYNYYQSTGKMADAERIQRQSF